MNTNIKSWTEIEAGKEAGHTETPWLYSGSFIENGERTKTIAQVGTNQMRTQTDDANARFICKAVNCHDELVRALTALACECEKLPEFHPSQRRSIELSDANDILKKAGEA